jgi:hypothetical protein
VIPRRHLCPGDECRVWVDIVDGVGEPRIVYQHVVAVECLGDCVGDRRLVCRNRARQLAEEAFVHVPDGDLVVNREPVVDDVGGVASEIEQVCLRRGRNLVGRREPFETGVRL